MKPVACIKWQNKRYELLIDEKLKAYTRDGHEVGKRHLKQLAERKGYKVKFI